MSYREFPVDIVKKACEDYIERREARIAAKREMLIDKEMSRIWFKPKSREAAKESLVNEFDSVGINEWAMCEWSGARWYVEVEKLLALCGAKVGSNSVFVDAEIAELIFKN